jgi:uncharacterized membrane protein
MNGVLWALQIVLAFAFLTVGWMHAFRSRQMAAGRPGMGWVLALPPSLVAFIGICEILGALGLILPPVTGVDPRLVPLAAVGLAAIMLLAANFHIARRERPNLVVNGVLFGLAVVVAYGRFAVVPL